MDHRLSLVAGPDAGRTFLLRDGQTFLVGRGQASDTQINDPSVSRIHCRLQATGGTVVLIDEQSAAGVLVDGRKVTWYELHPGEAFQLGDTVVRLDAAQDAEAATIAPRPTRSAQDSPLEQLVGETIRNYRLDAILAQGQTSVLFRGLDVEHQLPVAVKVLRPEWSQTEQQKQRFVRAVRAMLPVRHENLVRLYAAGKRGPYCWVAMELIEGESLTEVIQRAGVGRMLDWPAVWRVAVHVGRALACAAEQRIVHRHVTPANILRRTQDHVCLLADLVLAKALDGGGGPTITRPGELVGEAAYMSPEQTYGTARVDTRSDIYGLGATLYALLTGRPPFTDVSLPELLRQIRTLSPAPPKKYQLAVGDAFEGIVLQMIAKDPADRFQTPADLLQALGRVGRQHKLPGAEQLT